MADKKPLNQFCRQDGFNPTVDYSNSKMQKWIHKPIVVKTGDGEDDFIIDEKAVMVEEIDIQKSIQEEAKTTDLKALLYALLRQGITNPTGEEPELNKRPGFYGDITGIQKGLDNNGALPDTEEIKASLPEELQALSVEQLATMSDEEIISYFRKVKESKVDETLQNEEPGEKGNE